MMESNTGGCSATEPEGSTSADPLLANGGGVVRRVQEIVLAKGDGCAPVDGTATGEAAHAGGGGDGGETDRRDRDERDDDTAGGPGAAVPPPAARSASASASASSDASDASATTATATPSRSPTLSPDVAPHPQHRPQTHETPPPPPPPPPADDVDVDGEGEGLGPSDEDEDADADASMRDVGTGGGESEGEGDRDPSGADGSDAPTDDRGGTPSVKQLKGWLVDFEREQQRHHGEGNQLRSTAARPQAIRTSASVRGDMCVVGPSGGSCSAPSSPARKMKRANGFGAAAGATATPGRLLRKSTSLRVAAGEVQATDDGRAPVQTVSAWLTGGDPFREKRGSKGKNVKKLLSSSDGVPLVTKVDVTDRKKWLEGAFQKKGKEGGGGVGSREGSFDCGDSAGSDGERIPAFAPASVSAEHNHPAASATPEKARGSVKEAARLFGGSVSDAPRSARVREMREAMERRNEEVARSTDPRNFHRARWETPAGSTRPSAYKKKITDERGTAPKKCLADLP